MRFLQLQYATRIWITKSVQHDASSNRNHQRLFGEVTSGALTRPDFPQQRDLAGANALSDWAACSEAASRRNIDWGRNIPFEQNALLLD